MFGFVSRSVLRSRLPLCPSYRPRSFNTSQFLRERVIGIDLGTTNSCVAIIDNGQVVIENDGKRTTPSIFAVSKDGTRLVGQPAQRQMVVNPTNTFFGVKRLIGRRFDDDDVRDYQSQVPFSIKSGPNGDAWVSDSNGKLYSPSEIASNILIKLKEVAEEHCGESIKRAVITVPAYFDNHQRQATEDAGRIAGLQVDRIINEPTAAALAYGISKDEDQVIVVYDLGGGTFDVSVLQIGGGVFEVKSTSGDTFLGGEDFNNVISSFVLKEFEKKNGVDLSKDKVALQRVREASELAKHDLSTQESVKIDLPFITAGPDGTPLSLHSTITRAKYESLALPLVKRTIGPCQTALTDADLSIDDVTDVILVGGMTRMPLVRKTVTNFFKKEPSLAVNPDEAVAIGAALQGSIIAHQGLIPGEDSRELVLVDVTPLNLGIKVHSGEVAVIVPSQSSIPCSMSHTFTTVQDFQTEIHTEVYQGNRPLAKDNRLIGKYTMTGIPPAPAGVPQIKVTFEISANGTIKVSSMDEASKVQQDLVISMSGGLSAQDIARMQKEAEANKAADEAGKDIVKLKDSVSRDIQNIKKGLNSHKTISEDQTKTINDEIQKAQNVINSSSNKEEIEAALASLKTVSGRIFQSAYQSSSKTE